MEHTNTILIVDDQLSARETLNAALVGEGYNLVFAENGQEGLTEAADLLPDLIIFDIMMPGMDGFEVCERLRTHDLLGEVPVIMLTSLDDFETVKNAYDCHADYYATKSTEFTKILRNIPILLSVSKNKIQ